jgi:Na+-transporting NADH:ubiquinone oxidoreductase subunit NqrB
LRDRARPGDGLAVQALVAHWTRLRGADPRWFQIASLSLLLLWGVVGLAFDVDGGLCALMIGTAQLAQWVCTRAVGGVFDPKSALISSLSLCLLLRTDSVVVAVAAPVLAIGSKFAWRVRGKHVLNPTNGAIVLLLLVEAPMWVSPGQWGSAAFFAFLMACAGTLTVGRSARVDVVVAFLLAWSALVIGRSWMLGEPLAIPLHRLQSGALLLFAFFMLSDPKTTPDARAARVVYAVVVAIGAYVVQFVWFRTNGLLWSLAVCSLLVPLLDRVLAGQRFHWLSSSSSPSSSSEPLPAE